MQDHSTSWENAAMHDFVWATVVIFKSSLSEYW